MHHDFSSVKTMNSEDFNILNNSVSAMKIMLMIFEKFVEPEDQEDFEQLIKEGNDFRLAFRKFWELVDNAEISDDEEGE